MGQENSNGKDEKSHSIVVRLKGDATKLNRRADCSLQTCRLGSARLLSLVTTFKKILP